MPNIPVMKDSATHKRTALQENVNGASKHTVCMKVMNPAMVISVELHRLLKEDGRVLFTSTLDIQMYSGCAAAAVESEGSDSCCDSVTQSGASSSATNSLLRRDDRSTLVLLSFGNLNCTDFPVAQLELVADFRADKHTIPAVCTLVVSIRVNSFPPTEG
jgi:hypothetical protein